MYLRSALALEKHNPAEKSSNKRSVQIWPQEIVSTKTNKMAQAFCRRKVLFFPAGTVHVQRSLHVFFFLPFFFFFQNMSLLFHVTKSHTKGLHLQKKKANTSVIYKDPVVKITMLLSTLTKNMFAACQQRKKNKKGKKLWHKNYVCRS